VSGANRARVLMLAATALTMAATMTGLGATAAPGADVGAGVHVATTRERRGAWYRGDGTSKQTNHLRVHSHAGENARRVRQAARLAVKAGRR
jgi:hypothetical protein